MGVTTAAISQAIRIATLGEIDQNSARFSLSDRQIPIRVALKEDSRRNLSTIENLPVPTTTGGSVPLEGRRRRSASAPARPRSSASTRNAGSSSAPTSLRASSTRKRSSNRCPIAAEPARWRRTRPLRPAAGRGEADVRVHGRRDLRHLPRLRGAGPALQAADAAAGEHGLAAARAARRLPRTLDRPATRSRCRC